MEAFSFAPEGQHVSRKEKQTCEQSSGGEACFSFCDQQQNIH
jgi:hypothetical protein